MTDTTDISALRSKAANVIGLLTAEFHPGVFALDSLADVFDDMFRLLEAERQRADAAQTLLMPDGLHENTKALVIGFANAMAAKLYKSEQKYGWSDAWLQDDWQNKCLTDFNHHISKGDPLDVANYCAFMHYHGWTTTTVKGNNIDALETHTRGIEEALIAATDEIAALKAKLANPVVLPNRRDSDPAILTYTDAIKAINVAGFTVKGE